MPTMVRCAKLGRELPGIDPATPDGNQAIKMATLFGGPALAKRIRENVSLEAWGQWKDHMMRVINEFRLDPTSDEANKILTQQMEQFFFGQTPDIPNYVPTNER